jgi:hypothetical protein
MISPSVDVGEDLRQYARVREEEMRSRVDEYRATKERELKEELTKRVAEFELKKFVFEHGEEIHKKDSFLNGINDMCKRLDRKLTDLNEQVSFPDPMTDDVESDPIFLEFCAELDRVRFELECEILSYFKKIESDWNFATEHAKSTITRKVSEVKDQVISDVHEIQNRMSELEQRRTQIAKESFAQVSRSLDKELAIVHGTFENDCDELLTQMIEKRRREIRRLMLTLEKRIIDLSSSYNPKNPSRDELEIYASEIENLFVRYIRALSGSGRTRNYTSTTSLGTLETTMKANNVSLKERIKFIASFFEKYHSPELVACIANATSQTHVLDSIVSLRS